MDEQSQIQAGSQEAGAESNDLFRPISPEEPYLFESGAQAFDQNQMQQDFTYGSSPSLPSGDPNPEDFFAAPEELFKNGYLRPGGAYRVINPATKKTAIVIARHADENPTTGLRLAPHAIAQLGTNPQDGQNKYIFDFREIPEDKYPRATYPPTVSIPDSASAMSQGAADEAEPAKQALGDMSMEGSEGGAPQGSEGEAGGGPDAETPWVDNPKYPGVKYKRTVDGAITFSDGKTVYPGGAMTYKLNGAQFQKLPGEKGWKPVKPGEESTPDVPEGVTGEDAIKDLPPADQAAIRSFASYIRQPPTAGRVNPTYNRLEKYIMAYRPDYGGAVGYAEAKKVTDEFASTRPQVAGGQIISSNTAMRHIGRLNELSDKLDNSGIRKANGLSNYLKTETGNPNVLEFNRERDTLVGEFQKMITGGVPYSDDVRRGIDELNASNSPDQLKGVLKSMAGLMSDKLSEMDFRYSNVFKKSYPALVNPEAEKVARKLGITDFAGRNKADGSAPAAPQTSAPVAPSPQEKTFRDKTTGKLYRLRPGGNPSNLQDYNIVP